MQAEAALHPTWTPRRGDLVKRASFTQAASSPAPLHEERCTAPQHPSSRCQTKDPLTLDEARSWARAGVLAALALVLSYAETFIPLPVPVPGIKLGLANIIVLLALELLDFKSAAVIAGIKVLAAGFLFGNPLMMAYSALGTLFALLGMALLVRIPRLHIGLIAICGALLHNVGQLIVAAAVLQTSLVWASFPILAIAAVITGALTGAFAKYLLDNLKAGQAA